MLRIRINREDGLIWRSVAEASSFTLADLCSMVEGNSRRFSWLDEDGDLITIATDQDLSVAVEASGQKTLKLFSEYHREIDVPCVEILAAEPDTTRAFSITISVDIEFCLTQV